MPKKTSQLTLYAFVAGAAAYKDLRLVDYDVYRFGSEELTSQSSPFVVIAFFERLLQQYRKSRNLRLPTLWHWSLKKAMCYPTISA
jgi:hypothetical protein